MIRGPFGELVTGDENPIEGQERRHPAIDPTLEIHRIISAPNQDPTHVFGTKALALTSCRKSKRYDFGTLQSNRVRLMA
ncbi:hypothetical protein [Bradyrhizobium sp. RDM4]